MLLHNRDFIIVQETQSRHLRLHLHIGGEHSYAVIEQAKHAIRTNHLVIQRLLTAFTQTNLLKLQVEKRLSVVVGIKCEPVHR